LSKEERAALAPVQKALDAKDTATATTALAAAQGAVQGADARYVLGTMQVRLGLATNNRQLQAQGIDTMIASGSASETELPDLYQNQAAIALQANDTKKGEDALIHLMQLRPNDETTLLSLAQLRATQKRAPEALTLLERAITLHKATGQPVPEAWYKFAVKNAFDAKLAPQTVKFSREWVTTYPSPQNWRDALLVYRDVSNLDRGTELDMLRLMRAAHALAGERDYYQLASVLSDTGYPGEAKAVLDEGIAAKVLDPAKAPFSQLRASTGSRIAADKASLASAAAKALAAPTGTQALKMGDAYFGYGDYPKAADLYRAALQKGSVDANQVNTHLGLALGLAGQKAEAQTALQAITGPRAELANYMMVWLSQRS
ncbi:MAG: hypothetical protein ACM3YM_12300, partial [Sphingomonadales bacterium]